MVRVRLPAVALLFLACSDPLHAERLPIKSYTTADGLAHNSVNRIVRDSRGFMWFATEEGLSRFDGYAFTNYGVEHGLPHANVTDLLETKSGELWVATFGGLVLFRPDGAASARVVHANDVNTTRPMFAVVQPADQEVRARAINVLLESRDGTIWCGTRKGLFRLDRSGGRFELRSVDLGFPEDFPEQKYIKDIVEDEHGSLWVAAASGLYRRWQDGGAARYTSDAFTLHSQFYNNRDHYHFHDLMKDRDGRIWVASRAGGFFRIRADATRRMPEIVEHYGYPHTWASWVNQLVERSDRRVWAATPIGLIELLPAAPAAGSRLQIFNRAHGLSHQMVTTLAEDAWGNLWIGTSASGAMRIARNGFVTYERQDGVAGAVQMFEDSIGHFYIQGIVFKASLADRARLRSDGEEINRFGRFDGRGFEWFEPGQPFWRGWVAERSVMRTRHNEWWLAGGPGLFRYAPLSDFSAIRTATPVRLFTKDDGLPEVQVYRMFEDSRGDVWFSIISTTNGLLRWNRATDTVRDMTGVKGFPPVQNELPRAFGEDAAGNVWIGLNTGAARFGNGTFTFFREADGLPAGSILDIHADAAGRIWLATSRGGLVRIDRPSADRPAFFTYTTANGLSSNNIEVITEDLYGRIYVGTGRGVDQLDPATARVRHFTVEDGLAPGLLQAAFRDRTGALWFGTFNGLSRFVPPAPETSTPPPILITALSAAGQPQPVSALGETAMSLPDLRPGGNQLQIDYVSLRFSPGERLRYQYRLEGADDDWGPLTARRSVTYASLSPGRYRFLVRAVNAAGVASPAPAVVALTVLPPFWWRWWFLSVAALAIAAAAMAAHRYRLARILEIERVRTRIATDLHDDIGANLTRIAILSEVARQQSPGGHEADAPLSSIAGIARESATAMSDIVWAISPERDTLHDMVRKMRDHAEEVFETRDISLMLDLPDGAQPVKVGVDLRRDLYLIFKEAVNNAVRHSGCSRVSITLRIAGPHLILEVVDNGAGFDPNTASDGNGLTSMRRRAARLGASLDVDTGAGVGTSVRVTMPLAGSVTAATYTNR